MPQHTAAVALLLALAACSWGEVIEHGWDLQLAGEGKLVVQAPSAGEGRNASFTVTWPPQRDADATGVCAAEDSSRMCREWGSVRLEATAQFECLEVQLTTDEAGPGFRVATEQNITGHLYGGPENMHQLWPIEEAEFAKYSYVTKQQDNMGIAEPYWLFSDGFFFYFDPKTPLFIEQNQDFGAEKYIKFIGERKDPYPNPGKFTYKFTYCKLQNPKEAHAMAVENFLGKPTGIPDERMVTHPIWSTWARYKANINESVVMQFADEILKQGFKNSQLEIDDFWETCYGSMTFDKQKFPDAKRMTDALRAKGFRVTVWVHPFINENCDPHHADALEKGFLVKDTDGKTTTKWWNGKRAGVVDFSNPDAAGWWAERLRAMMRDNGVDSLKFDAGESSWLPQVPVLSGDAELQPNSFSTQYAALAAQFGPAVEVRVGARTQQLPIFVRMLDKDSRWDPQNGLPTLLTTLLQMNLVGYPFALPDMVGGNGYAELPSKELFVRWLQANVFMPAIQYSYVPWDFDKQTVDICKKYTELHAQFSGKIIAAMRAAAERGAPVNPPIWWADPEDAVALGINDEFLLGDDLLVAPVLEAEARSRDIYLPRGCWRDRLRGGLQRGPAWLRGYAADLHELPFFELGQCEEESSGVSISSTALLLSLIPSLILMIL